MSKMPAASPVEEVVAFFARGPSQGEIAGFHLSRAAQDHVRDLLRKNSAGTLTREESGELDKIMALNDVISLIRARLQSSRSRSDGVPTEPPTRFGT